MTHLLFHKTPNSVSSEPGAAQYRQLRSEPLAPCHRRMVEGPRRSDDEKHFL
jgi:hypothetical protein